MGSKVVYSAYRQLIGCELLDVSSTVRQDFRISVVVMTWTDQVVQGYLP